MIWLLAGVGILLTALAASRMKHPLRSLTTGAVCGAALLAALCALEPYTGFALPINRFTAYVCAVLGAPGVAALLFLQRIFQ